MVLGGVPARFSRPLHLHPEQHPVDNRQQIVECARRHRAADDDGDKKLATASMRKSTGMPTPSFCSDATTSAPSAMKEALNTLTAAMTRARKADARPGLHRGKGRHDVKAAAKRQPGHCDRDFDAAIRSEHDARIERMRRRREAVGRKSEHERENAEQNRAEHRQQQDDAPAGQPRGETRSDRRPRWKKSRDKS